MKRLAVYCGSTAPEPHFEAAARDTGTALAERGIGIVYGGGKVGMMGALADAALAAGGEVIGVIPDALMELELAHRGLSDLQVVRTMHERKARFTELSDGFLVLPGGTGTMDELWEAMSWAQLGYHANPVGLLNLNGYYADLIAFVQRMEETGFVRAQHRGILRTADTLEALLSRMAEPRTHRPVMQMTRDQL